MSSTDRDEADRAIKQFFESELLPLARRGQRYFPLAPDPAAVSYYTSRRRTTVSQADFHFSAGDSVESFEKTLVEMWQSSGNAELAVLAKSLARLAGMLREREAEPTEVSPAMYVIF